MVPINDGKKGRREKGGDFTRISPITTKKEREGRKKS